MKKILSHLLAPLIFCAQAQAAVKAEALYRKYDDGETQVTSPSVAAEASVKDDTLKIIAGYASDIVVSSSSDVRTFSSTGKIEEKRNEFSGGLETVVPDGTLGMGYIQSDENDYHSKIMSFSGTREFFQKNTTLGLGFLSGQDTINSSSNSRFHESMNHQTYNFSLAQVLSKISVIQVLYDLRIENGYIASPYRRAKVLSGANLSSVPENHPRTRNRNALVVKYNHHFRPLLLSSSTSYRLYMDSWGVMSHTLEERVSREMSRLLHLTFVARYYTQSAANFYQDYYGDDIGPFQTGNATLATYDSILVGVRPTVKFSENLELYGKLEYYRQDFKNATDAGTLTTLSDDKPLKTNALVFGVGAAAKF